MRGTIPVHPRGCGERYDKWLNQIDGSGSSPRVRGTRRQRRPHASRRRFIPAGAGNAFISML